MPDLAGLVFAVPLVAVPLLAVPVLMDCTYVPPLRSVFLQVADQTAGAKNQGRIKGNPKQTLNNPKQNPKQTLNKPQTNPKQTTLNKQP